MGTASTLHVCESFRFFSLIVFSLLCRFEFRGPGIAVAGGRKGTVSISTVETSIASNTARQIGVALWNASNLSKLEADPPAKRHSTRKFQTLDYRGKCHSNARTHTELETGGQASADQAQVQGGHHDVVRRGEFSRISPDNCSGCLYLFLSRRISEIIHFVQPRSESDRLNVHIRIVFGESSFSADLRANRRSGGRVHLIEG